MQSLISGIPNRIQFAKDGKYEEAWIIDRGHPLPKISELETYLDKELFKQLIVEFEWRSGDGENCNMITVIHRPELKASTPLAFMQKTLELFSTYQAFDEFIQRFDTEIIGFPCLFQSPLSRVRVGVINHWFSVGPVDIWVRGEEDNLDEFDERLSKNQGVMQSPLNYQAMAFIFNYDLTLPGPYHVIKAPCAHKQADGSWKLDLPKLNYYFMAWKQHFA